jgi:hypothetical protein
MLCRLKKRIKFGYNVILNQIYLVFLVLIQ